MSITDNLITLLSEQPDLYPQNDIGTARLFYAASGRVKIIPFERHFTEAEQDIGLKKAFRFRKVRSGILNWLVAGYRLLLETGFDPPERVRAAIAAYRSEADVVGNFLTKVTCGKGGNKLPTAELYAHYTRWATENGYKPLNSRNFVGELKRRLEVRHNGHLGNFAVGIALANS